MLEGMPLLCTRNAESENRMSAERLSKQEQKGQSWFYLVLWSHVFLFLPCPQLEAWVFKPLLENPTLVGVLLLENDRLTVPPYADMSTVEKLEEDFSPCLSYAAPSNHSCSALVKQTVRPVQT